MAIIYVSFEDLESSMIHAKFQDLGSSGSDKGFTIYGHVGHMTWTIYINVCPPLPLPNEVLL